MIPNRVCVKCDGLALRSGCQCCQRDTVLEYRGEVSLDEIYYCPHCRFASDDADAFDVLGADDGSMFCGNCGREFFIDAGLAMIFRELFEAPAGKEQGRG